MSLTPNQNEAPKLNEIYDVLIAGGGPGGTAVAFRATELGLKALVVEYDDLMKRIRDYSKSKLILPGFGGGDKLKFPKGGNLIDALRFGPIDKDAMCLEWKALYEKGQINKRIGLELTGLEQRADGCYQVKCWDHQARENQFLLARHVVLALGNGVPRRLDIQGDTEGIAFRMKDPDLFVGEPACVIGGGTSAAEAVIAISKAKVAAGDATCVYWSYRGDRLPRVSKALAEVFFEAYVGNGNIRYYPKSEPAAMVTHGDQRVYLSIRVDRRSMDDRPSETTHLEFPKEQCIACIGQDLPEALLNDLGIALVRGGPKNKKRIVVNRFLETCQPQVYMVGDLLSQAYLCTDDFDGDPTTFTEIKHRGNIKTALRDGVLVAEVINQRLRGATDIQIAIEDAEDRDPEEMVAHQPNATAASQTMRHSLPPVSMKMSVGAVLHRLLPSGIVESEHPLPKGEAVLGRRGCDIQFPDDPMLGDKHALLHHENGKVTLSCQDERLDIFFVLPPTEKYDLAHGDLLRVGSQFLLISSDQGRHWVNHYGHDGREVGSHYLNDKLMVFGRESPDVTLDESDMSLSRRHVALAVENGQIIAKDLKSANHTFLRMRGPLQINAGDRFQVGSKLFELVIGAPAHNKPVAPIVVPNPPAKTPSKSGEASVTFEGLGKTLPVAPGQTICDVAEAHGIPIKAECHVGVCGSDPIQIISGKEYLADQPSDGECETLEDICDLEPGPCRLACKARVKGPVVVKILQV